MTHCLTCNFHHTSQYNSFPSVWRGLTEHRREHPVYVVPCVPVSFCRNFLSPVPICPYFRIITALIEPCREKTGFLHMRKTKTQISCAVTAQLISAFVFATRIVQSLYYLNPKLQASSHLVWLYSPVCVGPGRKPRRPVFSQGGSILVLLWLFQLEGNKLLQLLAPFCDYILKAQK